MFCHLTKEEIKLRSWRSLCYAVEYNQIVEVKTLIQKLPHVNARTFCDSTLLHIATKRGYYKMAELLLAKGARTDLTDRKSLTPLHLAVNYKELVELLLARGADVHARDERKRTPLHLVTKDKKVVELLLAGGADIHARDRCESTPLHSALHNKELVELLLARGADPNAKNNCGMTPLHLAVKNHYCEVVELLLAGGANLHAGDIYENTALHLALKGHRFNIARDESVSIKCSFKKSHKKVVKFLIEKGANVLAENKYGESPLKFIKKYCIDCTKMMIRMTVLRNGIVKPDYLCTELSDFWNDCQRDVERMRTTPLLGECSTLSVHQFLRETDEDKLAGYFSNAGIRKTLKRVQDDFNIYSDIIRDQWNKGEKRKTLVTVEQTKKLPV